MSSPFISKNAPVCPEALVAKARALGELATGVVAAGAPLPMESAKEATEAGVIKPIFIGNGDDIKAEADALNWDISAFDIVEAENDKDAAAKGADMACNGDVQALMKGQLHTDDYMRAILFRKAELMVASRLFHIMTIFDPTTGRPLLVGDAAVNVAPDQKTRQIGLQMMEQIALKLDITRPKIALLSATEVVSDAVPSTVEAQKLVEWAKENLPNSDVSGPLSLDLALSQESASNKGLHDDPVAGDADAIMVPDIVAGNALFKSLVYFGAGCSAGLVMGAKLPLLLTSRSDPAEARLASAALASIMRG